jgi:hypothetical protein
MPINQMKNTKLIEVDIKIADDTIRHTTKCKLNFSCLLGNRKDLCKVEYCVGKIHFMKCLNKEYCDYQIPFGDSRICNCPTRKELYSRYKI